MNFAYYTIRIESSKFLQQEHVSIWTWLTWYDKTLDTSKSNVTEEGNQTSAEPFGE